MKSALACRNFAHLIGYLIIIMLLIRYTAVSDVVREERRLRVDEQSFEIGFETTRRRNCTKSNASWKRHPRTVGYFSSSCARQSDAAIS